MRTLKDYLFIYFKGISVGVAGLIPGLSPGSIALISGIYEELINSISTIDREALRLLFRFHLAEFWKKINGNFLLTVVAGIATSVVVLARLMTYLLQHHSIAIWSFFFGLILLSSSLLMRDIKKWNIGTVLSLLAGVVIAYAITVISPVETPASLPLFFFYGALAASFTVLPGMSGALVLLLIGKYDHITTALTDVNVPAILVFTLGCFVGLIGFSRFLSRGLSHYRFPTLALLIGFMIGSLNKVWPWREVTIFRIDQNGNQAAAFDKSVMPWNYLTSTGQDPHILKAVLFAALGILLVVAIEKASALLKTKS